MHFGPGVTHHVARDLDRHEGEQGQDMHRHEQQEQRRECAVHDRLGHGEGVGGPRRRRAGQMMRAMEQGEQAPVMHRPVGPVEIGVVGHQHGHERQAEIERPGLVEPLVERHPARAVAHDDDRAEQGEDPRRPQRGQDFAADVAARRLARLQFAPGERRAPEGEDAGHRRRGHDVTAGIHEPGSGQGVEVGAEQVVHRSIPFVGGRWTVRREARSFAPKSAIALPIPDSARFPGWFWPRPGGIRWGSCRSRP